MEMDCKVDMELVPWLGMCCITRPWMHIAHWKTNVDRNLLVGSLVVWFEGT